MSRGKMSTTIGTRGGIAPDALVVRVGAVRAGRDHEQIVRNTAVLDEDALGLGTQRLHLWITAFVKASRT